MNTFLTRMLQALDQAGIAYCLLRDADRLEQLAGGGEVDLLVEKFQLPDLKRLLAALGCVRLPMRGYDPHHFFVFYDADSNSWCKFDVVTEVAFGGPFKYLRTDLAGSCIRNRRRLGLVYAPSAEDEIVSLLLHCLLDKKQVAPHRADRLRTLRQEIRDPGYLSRLLARYWLPNARWEELASHIEAANWAALLAQRRNVECHLARHRQLAVRVSKVGQRAQRAHGRCAAFLAPKVPTVALLGPDGAGKSTLASGIGEQFCMPVDQLYMGLYPKRSQRTPRSISGLGFLRLLLSQWKRYLTARSKQARGHLVIFDRYPYDALLPARQRLGWPRRVRRWVLAHACPPPNLVMVLDAPGEVLHARKGEHTIELLEDQRQSYRQLQKHLPHAALVDATREARHVQRQVNTLIWEALRNRNIQETG